MKIKVLQLLLFVTMILGLSVPSTAFAVTGESDWTMTSSLSVTPQDSDKSLFFDVTRCRDLFDIKAEEISLVFTLNATNKLGPSAKFSLKYALGSQTCAKTVLDKEASDQCENIANNESLNAASSPLTIKRAVKQVSSATSKLTCENLQETAYLYLIVDDSANGVSNIYTVTYSLDFRTQRPIAPTELKSEAGGASINVNWTASANVISYKVYYGKEGAVANKGDIADDLEGFKSVTVSKNSASVKDGVSPNSKYVVFVTSVDKQGNESLVGDIIAVETQETKDFWDSYREENADAEGGFCFIATAAWGSTQEPHVSLLRSFRDNVLKKTSAGRLFIDTYYRLSPPLAHFIAQHDSARAVTRVALWPVYAVAYVTLHAPYVWGILLALLASIFGFILYRRHRKRAIVHASKVSGLALACVLAFSSLLLAPSTAHAEASPVDMMFEFKAGPYTPDKLGAAFDKHFGDKSGYIIEFEYDWQFYRGVGSLGIGLHLAYGSVTGKSLDTSGAESIDETKLHWLPLRLSLVYRFDYLWTRFDFPLTFYVKAGFDYAFWWIVDGSGSVANADDAKGAGGTFGFHVVAGAAFVLNWIDPTTAKSFDVESGVNTSYIFVEYMYAQIDNFGHKGLNLTDVATFHVGIGLEF